MVCYVDECGGVVGNIVWYDDDWCSGGGVIGMWPAGDHRRVERRTEGNHRQLSPCMFTLTYMYHIL